MLKLFISTLIILLLTGCQSPEKDTSQINTPQQSMTDTNWILTEFDGVPVAKASANKRGVHFILNSQDQRISGFNGCNRFFGGFTLKGEKQLLLSALGSTKMACQGLAIKESKVMDIFMRQASFQISAQRLTFYDQDAKPLATFSAQ